MEIKNIVGGLFVLSIAIYVVVTLTNEFFNGLTNAIISLGH